MSELLNSLLVGFSATTLSALLLVGFVTLTSREIPFSRKDFESREDNFFLIRAFLSMGFMVSFLYYVTKGTT